MKMQRLTLNRAVFVLGAALATLYGGAKHGSVAFPYTDPERRYLYDAGSYVTNGYAHIAFRTLLVPQSATIYAYSRAAGSTNDEEWVERMAEALSALYVVDGVYLRDLYFDGAETNDLQVFTDWTPGPAAHTNGIAEIQWRKGFLDPSNAATVPWRTGLYIEGIRIAPNPAMTNGLPASLSLQLTPNNQHDDE